MDIRSHNRAAWDILSRSGDRWGIPVEPSTIAAARRGKWSVVLTNSAPVPRAWFPASLVGLDILGLASAGGQQGPIFAAAGARVTVLDNSPEQLARDAFVAKRDKLDIRLVEGTMEDLSAFANESFDLVFNPASVFFTRDVRAVWREAARVLRPGGTLLSGFLNPAVYLFEKDAVDGGPPLLVTFKLPYSDERDLPKEELAARVARREPLGFSHTLTDLLGGQMDAGLQLVSMYEDVFGDAALDAHMPGLLATRAVKPS